jgi:rhamnosyltransferase
MAAPQVSIVLPTLNGEEELRQLLPALAVQELPGGWEICAVDSSSTDRSAELLRAAGARVEVIPRAEFRHGATRNRCAAAARGEFLVFLSQDVLPANEVFLAALIGAFRDPRVAGACARVLPHPASDPLTARTVLDLPEAGDRPAVRDLDGAGGVWRLAAAERARRLRFNNVASAIRASVFRAIPFPPVSFGEDFAWAARALTAGWRIAYGLGAAFERYRVDAAFHRLAHSWRVRPSALSALRGFAYEVALDARFLRARGAGAWMRHLWRSPALRAAQVLGQYVGSQRWDPRSPWPPPEGAGVYF